MELKGLSFNQRVLRYGFIVAAIPALYNLTLVLLGLQFDYQYYGEGIGMAYERVTLLVMPALLILALNRYKRDASSRVKLSEAFKLSFMILTVICITTIGYNIIFRALIVPDFTERFYEINRDAIFAELVECCDYSQENLENHERTNGRLSNKLSAFVFTNFIFGMITTLITGLIIRRPKKVEG